jgi:predicted glycosyltransferase
MRRDTIRAVVASFRPHAIVVDKVAQGVGGELIPTLTQQHACGTRCILGLRDILDEPSVVQREWEAAGGDTWIDEIYDHIWIYGDPLVYDAVHEYGFTSSVARKIQYTGYLDQVVRSEASELAHDEAHGARHSPCRNVTCVLGGGQDGAKLAEAFCRTDFGNRWHGTLITGPFMPEPELSRLRQLVSGRTDITLIPFASDAERYIRCADRVISMGGYNTVCSILSHNRHALVVPRTQPRQEQWIRATRLQNLGLLSTIDPEQLTSVAIRQWLDIDLPDPPDVRRLVDLNGLGRVADWFRQLPTSHRCTPGTHARRFADERRDPPHAHLSAHRSGQQSPDGYSVWL